MFETDMLSFPDLPLDVARHILEISAMLDGVTCAQKLILVSRSVKNWVYPVLYHTVLLDEPITSRQFIDGTISILSKDPGFLARHVKVLRFRGAVPLENIKWILLRCTGVRTLSLWLGGVLPQYSSFQPFRATHLSLAGSAIEIALNGATPMSTVTHLNLDCAMPWNGEEKLFEAFPNLTHLLLDVVAGQDLDIISDFQLRIRHILSLAPSPFRTLIFEMSAGIRADGSRIIHAEPVFIDAVSSLVRQVADQRFIFLGADGGHDNFGSAVFHRKGHDPILDWGYGAPGESNAWEMAEEYMRNMKRDK